MTAEILQGDVIETLRTLSDESVHCCITSPPYHQLRSYLPDTHPDKQYELGLEPTFDLFLERMVGVFREVRRVLRRDGVCWVNMGSSYACAPNGRPAAQVENDDRTFRDKPMGTATRKSWRRDGAECTAWPQVSSSQFKPKDLIMQPELLAEAMRRDGWWLRAKLPWVKRSAMPCSVTDRPGCALEYVMLFSRSERYYFDADAVRRGYNPETLGRYNTPMAHTGSRMGGRKPGAEWVSENAKQEPNPNGRNLRNSDFYFDSLDLAIEQARAELAHLTHLRERGGLLLSEEGEPLALDVNTEASKEAHFAAFPRKLVQPLVQAGTSERGCCSECGAPWVRVTEKVTGKSWHDHKNDGQRGNRQRASGPDVVRINGSPYAAGYEPPKTLGWRKSCRCETDTTQPCTVLDPFAGTGTTLFVAMELGRRAIGIELSPKYVEMARRRLRRAQLPLDLVAD